MNPEPFTLRELIWMAEGCQRERWGRASSLMALLANCHKDPKKGRPARPSDFNPFAGSGGRRRGIPLTRETFGMLKNLIKAQKK